MSASREFMVICQAQLSLLVESLGVSSAIVYLTESWSDGETPQFKKVASVPIEGSAPSLQISASSQKSGLDASLVEPQSNDTKPLSREKNDGHIGKSVSPSLSPSLRPIESKNHQLVLPLLHDDRVLGILVAERSRPWDGVDQPQVDAIRQSLTAACLMDQRSQWFEEQSVQQQIFQRQQKDLFDNLLHQFRNPLTAMRTFGKLLVKRLTESDRNREAAASIVRESDRLQALLVQFEAAIDAGGTIPQIPKALISEDEAYCEAPGSAATPTQGVTLLAPATLGRGIALLAIDLQSILNPALQSASGVIDDRQQQLHLDLPENSISILADPIALAEVLTNLIDNASKYTPSRGHIQIKLMNRDDDRVDLWITDTGYGIPPEDLAHLFERHYRGVQAQSAIPGTGLGLSIARELTRQMQGDIQVFSPPPRDLAWPSDHPHSTGTSIQLTLQKASSVESLDKN